MTIWRRVQRLDHALMRRSYEVRSPTLDRTLVNITRAANYSRLWLIIAAALGLLAGRRGQRAAGRGVIAIAIAAIVANGPAKLLTRRRRPFSRSRPALIRMPRSTSFPSGHTAAAFAFATAASAEMPILAPALVPIASAVAYSRVHTGVHFPSDVTAGVAIGVGSGLIAGPPRWRRLRDARAIVERIAVTISARSPTRAHPSPPPARP
jgi:membrane-associated phospholipid phosphatase